MGKSFFEKVLEKSHWSQKKSRAFFQNILARAKIWEKSQAKSSSINPICGVWKDMILHKVFSQAINKEIYENMYMIK